jgi:hypothetical protein
MEDVLDLYMRPYDSQYPVICMDEKPFQLTDEKRTPIPMKPLKPERRDSEYIRKGTCSIFVFTEPLVGWRHYLSEKKEPRWTGHMKLRIS